MRRAIHKAQPSEHKKEGLFLCKILMKASQNNQEGGGRGSWEVERTVYWSREQGGLGERQQIQQFRISVTYSLNNAKPPTDREGPEEPPRPLPQSGSSQWDQLFPPSCGELEEELQLEAEEIMKTLKINIENFFFFSSFSHFPYSSSLSVTDKRQIP